MVTAALPAAARAPVPARAPTRARAARSPRRAVVPRAANPPAGATPEEARATAWSRVIRAASRDRAIPEGESDCGSPGTNSHPLLLPPIRRRCRGGRRLRLVLIEQPELGRRRASRGRRQGRQRLGDANLGRRDLPRNVVGRPRRRCRTWRGSWRWRWRWRRLGRRRWWLGGNENRRLSRWRRRRRRHRRGRRLVVRARLDDRYVIRARPHDPESAVTRCGLRDVRGGSGGFGFGPVSVGPYGL